MKKLLIVILMVGCFSPSYGQDCGHEISPQEIKVYEQTLIKNRKVFKKLRQRELKDLWRITKIVFPEGRPGKIFTKPKPSIQKIPISAHIVRDEKGSGGISTLEIRSSLNTVNTNFAPIGFEFVLCNTRYIDDSTLYNTNYISDTTRRGRTKHEKSLDLDPVSRNIPYTINVYFYPSGTSWTYSPSKNDTTQHIMMQNGHVKTDVVFTHELAHWFSLLHTHGKQNGLTEELVDGSNCQSTGDYVCDTPADPGMSGIVNAPNCTYSQDPAVVDANGEMFNPDPSNFMSYAIRTCRNNFTDEQYVRMVLAYHSIYYHRGYNLEPCKLLPIPKPFSGIPKNR